MAAPSCATSARPSGGTATQPPPSASVTCNTNARFNQTEIVSSSRKANAYGPAGAGGSGPVDVDEKLPDAQRRLALIVQGKRLLGERRRAAAQQQLPSRSNLARRQLLKGKPSYVMRVVRAGRTRATMDSREGRKRGSLKMMGTLDVGAVGSFEPAHQAKMLKTSWHVET